MLYLVLKIDIDHIKPYQVEEAMKNIIYVNFVENNNKTTS